MYIDWEKILDVSNLRFNHSFILLQFMIIK